MRNMFTRMAGVALVLGVMTVSAYAQGAYGPEEGENGAAWGNWYTRDGSSTFWTYNFGASHVTVNRYVGEYRGGAVYRWITYNRSNWAPVYAGTTVLWGYAASVGEIIRAGYYTHSWTAVGSKWVRNYDGWHYLQHRFAGTY